MLVIIESYCKVISNIVKFQTWQLIIKFGVPALSKGDTRRFCDVTNFSLGLDLSSGLLAMLIGMIALPFVSQLIGIAQQDLLLSLFYCTLIPFMVSATSTGILRAYDRFDLISIQQVFKPMVQALGSVVAWYWDLGFAGFIITWYLTSLSGNVFLWLAAVRELNKHNVQGALKPSLFVAAKKIKSSWSVAWTINLAHSIYSIRNIGSNVLVGMLLGPAAAGIFKIACSFFSAASTPSDLLEKSLYPEIMRMSPSSKKPWLLSARASLVAAGLGVIMLVLVSFVGKPLIGFIFGEKYLHAYGLLHIMLWAVIISMAAFPLDSLLYMAHRHHADLVANIISTAGYLVSSIIFIKLYGIQGAAFGMVAGEVFNAVTKLVPVISAYKTRATLAARE